MPDLITLTYRPAAQTVIRVLGDRVPRGWGQTLDRIGAIYLTAVQAATPVSRGGPPGRAPGTLRAAWRLRSSGTGGRSTRILSNADPALVYVRKGRRAIDQRGKGHPLHFWAGGRELWRWRVKGVAPNDFVVRARNTARAQARPQFASLAAQVLGRRTNHW